MWIQISQQAKRPILKKKPVQSKDFFLILTWQKETGKAFLDLDLLLLFSKHPYYVLLSYTQNSDEPSLLFRNASFQ